MTLSYIIDSKFVTAKGERADRIISQLEGLPSRSQLKRWFNEGRIRRKDGKILEAADAVFPGDEIIVDPAPQLSSDLVPYAIPLEIFHEDESLIVLYKPKGLSMHPGAAVEEKTLVHALLAHSKNLSKGSENFRPGIVHRLDKDTEGIVVVAKNDEVHEDLSQQFSQRSIERAYWALVYGKFPEELLIEGNIGRNPRDRKKMTVLRFGGKFAKTEARRRKYFDEGYSWIECKLHTGRTHQIRVHLNSKGYPVLGDPQYSKPRKLKWSEQKQKAFDNLKGQALVAFRLGFIHPLSQEKMRFEIDTPEWMRAFLD